MTLFTQNAALLSKLLRCVTDGWIRYLCGGWGQAGHGGIIRKSAARQIPMSHLEQEFCRSSSWPSVSGS